MSVQYLRAVYTCDQCGTESEVEDEVEPDGTLLLPANWIQVRVSPSETNQHYCAFCYWNILGQQQTTHD